MASGVTLNSCPDPIAQASLQAYFEENYGAVEKVMVRHPQQRNHSYAHTRSFGFVTVFSEEVAQAVMKATHVIDGHTVAQPELAKPTRAEKESPRTARGGRGDGARAGIPSAASNARPNAGHVGGWDQSAPRKIFVGGLSHQTKEQALYACTRG